MNSQQRKKISITTIFIISIFLTVSGQNTNSPYSIFGLGELQQKGFGKNIAMGGTGIGMSSTNFINNTNPASYSGFDSLRFIYELGTEYKYSHLASQGETRNDDTFNFKYIALGCRINDWWSASLGITPFSNVGYSIVGASTVEGASSKFYSYYEGSGGVNQVYMGNALNFGKLSLGMHAAYIFGSIIQDEQIISSTSLFTSFIMERTHYLKSFYCDFGLQYQLKNKGKWNYNIGAVYTPRQQLTSSYQINVETTSYTTVSSTEDKTDDLIVPTKYGAGINAKRGTFVNIAADYEFQKWDGIRYLIQNGKFKNSHRFAIGTELRPWRENIVTRDWYKKIVYRLGANYTLSYITVDGVRIKQAGITAGVGVPLKNLGTMMNFTVEAGTDGSGKKGLIRENYALIHLNLSINEAWFKKKIYY